MKKKIIYFLLVFFTIMASCKRESNEKIEVYTYDCLQYVIDSLVENSSIADGSLFELFVDRRSEHRCDMILHIGKYSYYNDSILSFYYINSLNNRVNIYSGIEAYFNSSNHFVNYIGSNKGIEADDNNLLWVICMYKDSIIDIYSTEYVNPYLIITSSPKDFIYPNKIE